MPVLTLYYDIVCPYAYLGATQAQAFADAMELELRWCPILLGGVFKALGTAQEPAATMSPAKARLNLLDMLRQAELLGVEAAWHPHHPVRTVRAMRLLVACPEAIRPALSLALYRAYWVEHRDVSDPAVLSEIALAHGVDPSLSTSSSAKEALFRTTAEAVELGGFGVPIWRLSGEGHDRFWWGADRLPLVAAALGRSWPAPSPYAPSSEPRPITFFHDFSSPFSYLGNAQIDALAEAEWATVERVPILLGALFSQIGTPNVPLLAMAPAKATYLARDMREQAATRGIPFTMPSAFPLRTVLPLRVALLQPDATHAIYQAAWVHNLNIGQPEVLRNILDDAGFSGAALIEATQDPAVKARLRANTERAHQAGACGVPTFQVGGQIFWGQDRLEQVRQAVRGWRGPTLQAV